MSTIISIRSLNVEANDQGLGVYPAYQYGVRFPDGKQIWAVELTNATVQVEGRYVNVGPTVSNVALSFQEGNDAWKKALATRGVPGWEDMNLVQIRRPIQVIVNPTETW